MHIDALLVAREERQRADQFEGDERVVLPVRPLVQEPSAQIGQIGRVMAQMMDPDGQPDRGGVHGGTRCQRAQHVERVREQRGLLRDAFGLRPLPVLADQRLGTPQAIRRLCSAVVLRRDLAVDGVDDRRRLRGTMADRVALVAQRGQTVLRRRAQEFPNLVQGESQRLVAADATQGAYVVVAV